MLLSLSPLQCTSLSSPLQEFAIDGPLLHQTVVLGGIDADLLVDDEYDRKKTRPTQETQECVRRLVSAVLAQNKGSPNQLDTVSEERSRGLSAVVVPCPCRAVCCLGAAW